MIGLDDRETRINAFTGEKIEPVKGSVLSTSQIDRLIREAFAEGNGKGYDPDQLRVPAGQSGGGRWTSGASVGAVAEQYRSQAQHLEAATTERVMSAVANNGGKLAGLEFRLKEKESLERKIAKEAETLGVSPDRVEIRDALRYTALFSGEDYSRGVSEVQKSMAAQGWVKYDHQFKNYWGSGDAYDGYNAVFVNEDGFKVELQFHTPESMAVKERSHKLYEAARVMQDGPERRGLIQGMKDLWRDVPRPVDWRNLPGVMITAGGT